MVGPCNLLQCSLYELTHFLHAADCTVLPTQKLEFEWLWMMMLMTMLLIIVRMLRILITG